jgi:3-oxoacyl-[acyl-carrier protein] reductase
VSEPRLSNDTRSHLTSVIDLSGRVAVVTGASRGIGRATAESFLKAGCSVILNARASDEASTSFSELEQAYPTRASVVYGSVADGATASAVVQSAISRHKRIDILVNNAGILRENPLGMISDAEMHELFDVNLVGLMRISQIAADEMTRRRSGSIVNVSSIVGIKGSAGQVAYAATKAGVIGATHSTARELGQFNIRVNAVAPGFIDTSMTTPFSGERRKRIESNIAMGRVGSAQDVANVILFLVSDLASYVTGQVVGVDGGLVL